MKILRLLGIAILLTVAGGGGYYAYTHYLHVETVTTSIARVAPVSEAIYGTGTVEPQRWAKVVPLQRRRLIELCSCEGQNVKAGQVLGRQDDAEERSELQQLEVNSDQLQRDLNRAEQDRGKSDAAQREYEQRWTQFQESKSRIAAQKVRLDSLVLRAPLEGMVLRRDGEVGEIAGPTDVLFWVGPPTPMQVVAEVNEEEINRIAVGQKAYLRSEAFPGLPLRANVAQITPKGDPTRKTFRVYLLLPQDTPLKIGMSVEANIIFREKTQAIVVPAEAVAGDAVQTVNNGKLERLPIRLGVRGSRNVEIIGDVSRGMAVLSPARPDLADGTRVRVERSTARPEPETVEAPDTAAEPAAPLPQTRDSASPPVIAASAPSATATVAPADPDAAVISSAISAHVDSVVSDARRNVAKLGAAR
ncbi:MAG: efflux RND transporter periplasmic adaptor subunit [Bradyrhizobium sp.]|uniref:efflux RND transporter periplasmic adaptor subunit n=1 Tax=Bradyrhizobium sp. TaxID=376 RepID=UPI001D543851|nr:efflux RND transporter periplasmic adaptor subunit [Bradyrhizobium sp.]MBV9562905.1 efflux RND transporter periplasmic adaptor subunit [Bradyrhizobium sp.]